MMTTAPDIWQVANFAFGLLLPLLAGVCAVFCFVHRRLSAWLALAGAGFLLYAVVGVVNRVGFHLLAYFPDVRGLEGYGLFFLAMTLGYIVGFMLILLGLALGLGEIRRRMRRLEQEPGGPHPRLGAEDAREAWRPRQEGSRDIQQ